MCRICFVEVSNVNFYYILLLYSFASRGHVDRINNYWTCLLLHRLFIHIYRIYIFCSLSLSSVQCIVTTGRTQVTNKHCYLCGFLVLRCESFKGLY